MSVLVDTKMQALAMLGYTGSLNDAELQFWLSIIAGGGLPPSGTAGGDLGGSFPNPTISKISGALTSYNGTTLVANGVATEVATFASGNLTANQTTTLLYAVPASKGGMYRISAYAVETVADAASSTLPSIGIQYTDSDTSVAIAVNAVTSTNPANAVGAFGQGTQIVFAKAGTNINWLTSGYASGTAGTMTYHTKLRVEYLG